jgi:hypothetical protein
MFPGFPFASSPFTPVNPSAFMPYPFMGQPFVGQSPHANMPAFGAAQPINPWLVLAWLNQFNPYAQAFSQQPPQFSWQAFWNANPAQGFAQATPSAIPNFAPAQTSQGIFGTSNFYSAPAPQPAPTASSTPSYPNYPGVPSFFSNPHTAPQFASSQPSSNPLDEHAPPKRTARNGV